jgi:hypothetical protein
MASRPEAASLPGPAMLEWIGWLDAVLVMADARGMMAPASGRPSRVVPTVVWMVLLVAVVAALGFTRHGYAVLGIGGAWAWVLAAVHTVVLVAVTLQAMALIRWADRGLADNPFLPDRHRRAVSRRSLPWRVARVVLLLSVVAVIAVGVLRG